jgi:hypothetical protein
VAFPVELKRNWAIAKPPAAGGAVMITLVIGDVLDPAASSAPALPLMFCVTVPNTVDPLMNVAEML